MARINLSEATVLKAVMSSPTTIGAIVNNLSRWSGVDERTIMQAYHSQLASTLKKLEDKGLVIIKTDRTSGEVLFHKVARAKERLEAFQI